MLKYQVALLEQDNVEPKTRPQYRSYPGPRTGAGGSTMVRNGSWAAGYAMVTLTQVIEVQALLNNTSAQ